MFSTEIINIVVLPFYDTPCFTINGVYDGASVKYSHFLDNTERERERPGNGITRNVEANAQALNTAIDIYISDFGTLEVVYSPFSRPRSALVLDTSLWAMATLPGRAFMETDLAKTGDTMRRQILTEWTIEARNESGNGIIADLTIA